MSVIAAQTISIATPEFAERQSRRNNSPHQAIWRVLDSVCDPELPGLTIWDLGVLQDVDFDEKAHQWLIKITTTYSGCPAVETIADDVKKAIAQSGHGLAKIQMVLAPAWSTEMMSPAGRAQLAQLQISPPKNNEETATQCPHCGSYHTHLISQFGSTACKSLYQCDECQQPFDYFKKF